MLCALVALVGCGTASADAPAGAETRVRGLDLGNHYSVRLEDSPTRTHQGCGLAYDDLASDFLLAARGASRVVDANRLNHIFGKAGHNLEPLVGKLGSQEAVFTAVEDATQAAVKSGGLTGVFETTVSVAGQNVVVRGNVMDGVVRIGTFFTPPVP
jgi:hypothetical protein